MPAGAPHFSEITLLRAFAVLAVVLTHVYDTFTDRAVPGAGLGLYMTATVLLRFAVPCFLFVSGYVLYSRYPVVDSVRAFWGRRFWAVIPAYLVASEAGIILRVAVGHTTVAALTPSALLGMLLTGTAFYHLWFFLPLIQLYLLYPAIAAVYGRARARGLEGWLLAASLGCAAAFALIPDGAGWLRNWVMFAAYLFFFVLGMAVSARGGEVAASPQIRVAGAAVVVAGVALGVTGFGGNPTGSAAFLAVAAVATALAFAVVILALLRVARRLRGRGAALLERLGERSFGVYLVHAFLLSLLGIAGHGLGFVRGNAGCVPVAFGLVLAASYVAVGVIRKVPYGSRILGR